MTETIKNWSGNISYSTGNIHYPESTDAVQALVKKYPTVKPLGTGHCFNTIADSKHQLIAITAMNKVLSLDAQAQTVTVQAGIKYGELCPYLHQQGYALHNLASLPHISVAGSCATATHGSGTGNGNLATAAIALEMVTADGTVVQLSKKINGDHFLAAVTGLGALGIVTSITLQVQPAFSMRQYVFLNMPLKDLLSNFESVISAGYSVSLFTSWQQNNIDEVWIKTLTAGDKNYDGVNDFHGARPATADVHPIPGIDAINCTPQLGVDGPWHERLPHFKMGFVPSSGAELQSEYFIPLQHTTAAIEAVARLGALIGPQLLISEIRSIAADEIWMSPCYQQSCAAIHFTWKLDWPAVSKILPLIEQALHPFNVLPHWGKLFTMQPALLAAGYPKMEDFKSIIKSYDPEKKFANDFLERYIY